MYAYTHVSAPFYAISQVRVYQSFLVQKLSPIAGTLLSFGPLKSIWKKISIGRVVPVEMPRELSNAIDLHYGECYKGTLEDAARKNAIKKVC